ncbi:MAG: hypothetical protein AAB766_04595 [Patescibacteria group bacterium]
MAKRKTYSTQKMSWQDFRNLVNGLDLPPMHSYEIVNDAGCVVAKVIGEEELKKEAFSGITLSDVEKFFEKHADDFNEAQALIAKIRTAKKPLKFTKKELAEAKRKIKKFHEITEKVKERVYGKNRRDLFGHLSEVSHKLEHKLEKKLARRKRRQVPCELFDRDEDRDKLKESRKALKTRRAHKAYEKAKDVETRTEGEDK